MMSFAFLILPYSIGVKDTMKFVPSLPYDSSVPFFGKTVNSGSDSAVKFAVKSAICFVLFVSLKETLVERCRFEQITIESSGSGSVASSSRKYL